MRIGIESSSLHWSRKGGVSRLTRCLLSAYRDLRAESLQIQLFHAFPGDNHLYKFFPDITPPWLYHVPMRARSKIMALALRPRKLDLVHYPCEDLSPLFWLAGKRTIVTIHAAALHSLPAQFHAARQPLSWWISLRYLHRFITRIVSDSEFARHEISTYYRIPLEKISVIPLGVDLTTFQPINIIPKVRDHLTTRYNLSYPYILNVASSYQPLKNIPYLINAFAACRKKGLKHHLVIAGKGGGWQAEKIYRTISENNLEAEVTLTGYIEEKDLPALYSAADVFVFPSLYEGFGLPVLEAMACGTPVITSRGSSLPEVAGDAAILINPEKVVELAQAITKVTSDPGYRNQLRERGLQQVKSFSWEKTARAMIRLYRECAERR